MAISPINTAMVGARTADTTIVIVALGASVTREGSVPGVSESV